MVVKQGDLRSNLKKYFDIVVDVEPVVVPRKDNRNVVIVSEEQYRAMMQNDRVQIYSTLATKAMPDVPMIKSYTETTDIKSDNLDRLAVMAELKDNWNGNGATAFDRKLLKKVTNIINNLEIQPEIFPTAMGTIELEYDNSRRDFMSIEIGSDRKAEVFIVMYNGRESFENLDANSDAINERVKRFYE